MRGREIREEVFTVSTLREDGGSAQGRDHDSDETCHICVLKVEQIGSADRYFICNRFIKELKI